MCLKMNVKDSKTAFQTILPNITASKPSDNLRLIQCIPNYPCARLCRLPIKFTQFAHLSVCTHKQLLVIFLDIWLTNYMELRTTQEATNYVATW
jgi:hypothetical protein